jgi:rsbT co-antagonist protein RsbR
MAADERASGRRPQAVVLLTSLCQISASVPLPAPQLLGQDLRVFRLVLDSLDDPIFVKDRQHRWILFNAPFCRLLGRTHEELLGKSDPDYFPPDQVQVFWTLDDQLFKSGESNENEEFLTDEKGLVHTIWTRKYPVRDQGEVVGLVGIISDITSLRERLDAIASLEATTAQQLMRIQAQQELIDSMEIPMISVWEGILLVPLVGEVSERRAQLVLERLLNVISRESIRVVFLDISGVPTITEWSAATLLRAVSAARLLGAEAEIVGVSASIAQLLTTQEISFAGVRIHSSLRVGLRAALLRLTTQRAD